MEQSLYSWGYFYDAVFLTMVYGSPLVVLAFLCSAIGSDKVSERVRLRYATTGAVLVGLCGLALAGVSNYYTVAPETLTDRLFGAGALMIGVGLLWPLVWCLLLRRRLHPE